MLPLAEPTCLQEDGIFGALITWPLVAELGAAKLEPDSDKSAQSARKLTPSFIFGRYERGTG